MVSDISQPLLGHAVEAQRNVPGEVSGNILRVERDGDTVPLA